MLVNTFSGNEIFLDQFLMTQFDFNGIGNQLSSAGFYHKNGLVHDKLLLKLFVF